MAKTIEERKEYQRQNLKQWREKNREHSNKIQLKHSTKYQRWITISKQFLRGFPPDIFL
jgi:hypothetical protein